MKHYAKFFEQVHRVRQSVQGCRDEDEFAGANAYIPPDVYSVLDVGCGSGQFLRRLPDTYLKVGIDISYEALARVGAPRTLGSVDSLPFASSSFDLVTCFEVLEHLPYQTFPRALQELERVSRKYIMVSVPNREVLTESLVWCPHCLCAFNPSWHVRAFDKGALSTLFTQFRMVECRSCGPVVRYGSSRLASLIILLARRRPPFIALCPQCGYSKAGDGKSSDETTEMEPGSVRRETLGGVARRIATAMLFRARRPYWLLALYTRMPERG